jgi:sugar O-acyltransferase (sialic acid O-acetyltransferase NeuD family)
MKKNKPILIYGSRGFGDLVRSLIVLCGYEFAGFIDDFNNDKSEILGNFEDVYKSYAPKDYYIALAIGYDKIELRSDVFSKIKSAGYSLPTLAHPKSIVHSTAELSEGVILMAGSIVDANSAIGSATVLWPAVNVNHDSIIGSNTFLSPSSVVCGFSVVGSNSFIGAGAVITDHVHLPDRCFVKAGEVVHRKSKFRVFST